MNSDSFFIRGNIKPKDKFFLVITYLDKGKWYLAHSQFKDNSLIFSSLNNKPLYFTANVKNNILELYWKDKLATDSVLVLHPCRDVGPELYSGLWYGITSNSNSLHWNIINHQGKKINTDKVYHAFLPKRYYTNKQSLYTFLHYQEWLAGNNISHGTTDGKPCEYYKKHKGVVKDIVNSNKNNFIYKALPKYKSFQKNIFTLDDLKSNQLKNRKTNKFSKITKPQIQEFKSNPGEKSVINYYYWIIWASLSILIFLFLFLFYKNNIRIFKKNNFVDEYKVKNNISEFDDNYIKVHGDSTLSSR